MDWLQLRSEFEALREPLRFTRLDYQWGAAGMHYRLAGGGSSNATRQFEVLAGIAGNQLVLLPAGAITEAVSGVHDAVSRWYEALREHSGAFEVGYVGIQTSATGEDMGHIYTGTLNAPAESSALLCLKLSTVPVVQVPNVDAVSSEHRSVLNRVEGYLKQEADRRGYLWLFIAFIITAVLAVLAL